ncbi:DinB family protein [Streptomyces sp. N2-109]|uniref:DinB family protein n=1 Tax=Streptomyces gossypii TaxID=2883101 RepID=A0ABT2K0Y5_9ACTN|nr:DinB family protein [Streptomyces gossypii]MCT2593568.1 DinB family protein [Streptomyces gossypii]
MTDTDATRGDIRPPGLNSDEIPTLCAFLDYLRDAVAAKLSGVGEEAARTPGVASGTSLLWLVTHLTAVEHNWFVWAYEGVGDAPLEDEAPPLGEETVAEVLDRYRAAVRRSQEAVARCTDPGRPGVRSLRETAAPSMRWTLVHMIEETARHAGHADILREQLDGSTGR